MMTATATSVASASAATTTISLGTCPQLSEIGRVLPIFKNKGDNFLFSNYRPISLLPVFSRILEICIHSEMFHFLVRYHIFYKTQDTATQEGHNSTQATLDFLQTIEGALCAHRRRAKAFESFTLNPIFVVQSIPVVHLKIEKLKNRKKEKENKRKEK